eukprot:6214148-Pleurochrysis_carterae.AAC.3
MCARAHTDAHACAFVIRRGDDPRVLVAASELLERQVTRLSTLYSMSSFCHERVINTQDFALLRAVLMIRGEHSQFRQKSSRRVVTTCSSCLLRQEGVQLPCASSLVLLRRHPDHLRQARLSCTVTSYLFGHKRSESFAHVARVQF